MKQLQGIACVALALTVMGFVAASIASATTLEVKGTKQTGSVTFKTSLKSGTSTLMTDTFGAFFQTCTASVVEGKTNTFTGTTVSGPISSETFSSCTEEPVTVDLPGSLSVENVAGTTNGTVRSINARWTMPSPFGALACVTASSPGTDIGTLTGVASGSATLHLAATLNCGSITAKWTGTYTVTSPEGLGVTS